MVRKSLVLMVVVFLLTVSGFALFIHSLNTQAIGEERGDRRDFLFGGRETSGEDPVVNTISPQKQPPADRWILMATDPDEGVGTDLKAIYAQMYFGIIYFKVEHYRNWTTLSELSDVIFMDADQDTSTGCPSFEGHITGTGSDYLIAVGIIHEMYRWDPVEEDWDWDNPISLAYQDAPNDTNICVAGVYVSDVETAGALDCAVYEEFSHDWMPDTGYFTFLLYLFCGDPNGDGIINSADVVHLINYLFKDGAAPDCY